MLRKDILIFVLIINLMTSAGIVTGENSWYSVGRFEFKKRIPVTIKNQLSIARSQCPIVIQRTDLPESDTPVLLINVVEPALDEGSVIYQRHRSLRYQGEGSGEYEDTVENNGYVIASQKDDIDKDGIWDELFFMTDLGPGETKTVYLYIGETNDGLFEHLTHAGMGYYSGRVVPFWEAENIGWKLFYPTDVDMHAKRTPMLTAYMEYAKNLSGYYMPPDYGTDIMTVKSSLGAGGVCVFEHPAHPDSIARPRFTPFSGRGVHSDTQYAFDIVYNGPLRSAIKVRTMNWNSGSGAYELEQVYTAYAHKSYSTCSVSFTQFDAPAGATPGCGIRAIMDEFQVYRNDGVVVSLGKDVKARFTDQYLSDGGTLEFEGTALVVPEEYGPEYRKIDTYLGNHTFRISRPVDGTFEYLIAGAWSEGSVNRTREAFTDYIRSVALEYNNPPRIDVGRTETKPE